MIKYEIIVPKKIIKILKKIPLYERERIKAVISKLADDPHYKNSEQLTGYLNYRIRIGNYRIIYSILKDKLLITIDKLGLRKDVYRDL